MDQNVKVKVKQLSWYITIILFLLTIIIVLNNKFVINEISKFLIILFNDLGNTPLEELDVFVRYMIIFVPIGMFSMFGVLKIVQILVECLLNKLMNTMI